METKEMECEEIKDKSPAADPFDDAVGPAAQNECKNNIFKHPVDLKLFYSFIGSICPIIKTIKDKDIASSNERAFFTLDISAFKRGIFMGVIDPFARYLASECYHTRYKFYAERPMSTPSAFAYFVQIVRHVCKSSCIELISSLKYEQSQSNKVYYIEIITRE
jgi:hypothetical protein